MKPNQTAIQLRAKSNRVNGTAPEPRSAEAVRLTNEVLEVCQAVAGAGGYTYDLGLHLGTLGKYHYFPAISNYLIEMGGFRVDDEGVMYW
jgi:hypothetical protein